MTLDQLINAYKAVHDGIAPDDATQARLQYFVQLSQNQPADAQAMSYIVNSADNSTTLAVLSYQFFTGKAPTKAGLDYLVNSSTNPNDLNDRYYSGFSLENRYINFAANLGVYGEGAAAFASKYGTLSFADYVASIYQTIVGSAYATGAGVDPAKAIADIVARKDAILATATASGMITPNMTPAQIDIALKAATAGYLLGEAAKADVGLYASSANNFIVAVANGTATYGTDITTTYAQPAGVTSGGGGQSVSPGFTFPAPVVTQPSQPSQPTPVAHAFNLTIGIDTLTGESLADIFTGTFGTGGTFQTADVLNGAGGSDTLTLTNIDAGSVTLDNTKITNIETLRVVNTFGALNTVNLGLVGFTDVGVDGGTFSTYFQNVSASTTTLSVANTTTQTTFELEDPAVAGGSDARTLSLTNVTGAANVIITADTPATNELETLNIVSNGTGNSITLGTDGVQTSMTTINISGSASLTLAFAADNTGTVATTINGAAMTGSLTVTGRPTIANTIIGGSGNDVIQLSAQGSNLVSGADVITLNGGADTVRFVGNVAAGTGGSTDVTAFAKITDFAVASDKLAFSAADTDFSLRTQNGATTTTTGLAKGTTAQDLTAADVMVIQTVAQNAGSAAPTANVSFIKLTTGVAFNTDIKTTFADALGTSDITGLAANGNYLISVYDTTHNQMVVAVVNVGGNADADNNLFANDFVNADVAVVGVLNMSAGDYSAFGAGNLAAAF